MNEQNKNSKIEQLVMYRHEAPSYSLLADDETLDHFVGRVTNEANKLIEDGSHEIIGISYLDKLTAVISYR